MIRLFRSATARFGALSLQRKFALVAGALMFATSLCFLILVLGLHLNSVSASNERAVRSVNRLLQAALENAMLKRDIPGLREIITDLGAQDGIRGVMIVNPEGEVRFSSYEQDLYSTFDDPALTEALASQSQQTEFRAVGGVDVLRSINPVLNKQQCNVCHGLSADHPVNGLLVIDYETAGTRRYALIGAALLMALGLVVVLAVEGGLWVALRKIVLDRVARLDSAFAQVGAGNLDARTDVVGGDEIGRLAGNFNLMSDRLAMSVDRLRASEAFLQDLIDAVPDGIRVIGPDFRIIVANAAYLRQVGADRASVVGQPCHLSSHGRDAPCIPTMRTCPVAALLHDRTESFCKFNDRHLRNGAGLSVEVSAVTANMVIDGQSVPCVIESIRDLEAEVQISHSERLSEIGLLAAGIAHEVYNPLSSIRLALRAVANQPNLTEATRNYLSIADTEISSCQGFTDGLLRLASRPSQHLELVALRVAIVETAALLNYQAEQSDAKIDIDIEGEPRVLAHDSEIRMLVFNLVLNAVHAMPDGGTVRVSCRADGAGRIRLQVADTGVGIPEDLRDKVMLPFWTRRADGSRGRGLGLTICNAIVGALGGQIGFESEVGRGTVFTVDLADADKKEE